MGETTKKPRFMAVLLSSFGIAALFIAAIGLYGVMAFDVARQTRDIGVRLALGATPEHVRRGVLGRGLRLAATGLVLLVVAGVASWLPARRATRVDPMIALRSD